MPPPDIRIRGIRTPLPSGYVLGRISPGTGDTELIDLGKIASHVAASGQVAVPSSISPPLAASGVTPGSYTLTSLTVSTLGIITAATSGTLASAKLWVGNGSSVPTAVSLSGDATLANTGALTLATVNANVGSFTNTSMTVNAKGLVTAASSGAAVTAPNGMLPLVTGDTTPGDQPFFVTDGAGQCIGVPL
jgi:hypothetical protein